MYDKQIKLYTYFRKTFKAATDDTIDSVLEDLLDRFPNYYEFLVDLYIIIKEKKLQIHDIQKRKYKYKTELSRQNYTIKTQQDIVNKLLDNNIETYTTL